MDILEVSFEAEGPRRTCSQEKMTENTRKVCAILHTLVLSPLNAVHPNWEETSEVLSPPWEEKAKSGICVQHSGLAGGCLRN